MQILRRAAPPSPHIDRREDAAVHRHEMRRERHDAFLAGRLGEFLVQFRHVPVMADAVGVKALRHFGEQHLLLGRAPRTGHARFRIDHDLVDLDGLGLQERNERQLRRRGVAAGIGL